MNTDLEDTARKVEMSVHEVLAFMSKEELIDKIVEYMQGWNKVALVDFLGEEVYGDDSAPALLEEIIKAHRVNPFDQGNDASGGGWKSKD